MVPFINIIGSTLILKQEISGDIMTASKDHKRDFLAVDDNCKQECLGHPIKIIKTTSK